MLKEPSVACPVCGVVGHFIPAFVADRTDVWLWIGCGHEGYRLSTSTEANTELAREGINTVYENAYADWVGEQTQEREER